MAYLWWMWASERATRTATPTTGSETAVLEAQTNLPTGIELQAEVVIRSCGPINGVCHNEKEYPDLHTLLLVEVDKSLRNPAGKSHAG